VLDDLISVLRELRHVPLVAAEVRRMLGCAEIERLRAELRALGEDRLELHGWKAFSQGDEDGILAEIFGRVGVRHHTFVEIGAGSGLENNTVYLLQQGWRGLWVEAGKRNSRRIAADFEQPLASGQLKLAAVAATAENVNALVAEAQLAGEIDLLSVDVDGVDLYIWEALEAVTPRVVVIEYNGAFRPPVRWRIPYAASFRWDGRSTYYGASLCALNDLAERKGYLLVGCSLCGANAFFVRRELAAAFQEPYEPERLFQPPRYALKFGFGGGHRPGYGPARISEGDDGAAAVVRTEPRPAPSAIRSSRTGSF
jgi:hypothetical protein